MINCWLIFIIIAFISSFVYSTNPFIDLTSDTSGNYLTSQLLIMSQSENSTRLPTAFVSHGGGPSFYLPAQGRFKDIGRDSPAHNALKAFPKRVLGSIKPRAILLISAHWEERDAVHITANDKYEKLFYDYYGFPPETYKIEYNCPGDSQLAQKVHQLLSEAGIKSKLDSERKGYDHGVFIPLKTMFPAADIPVVQISLLASLDPKIHFEIGRALSSLRDEGVFIVGSGFITHNFNPIAAGTRAFVSSITPLLTEASPEDRAKGLINWQQLDGARAAHAREEHLIPLHVAAGAAADDSGHQLDLLMIMNDEWAFGNYAFGTIAENNK